MPIPSKSSDKALSNRIGVCSWSLSPGNPGSLIDRLHRLEIDGVQLALGPVIREPGVWGRAIDQLQGSGIRILSGMMAMEEEDYSTLDSIKRTGGVRPDITWPRNEQHAREVAKLAQRAGIGLVTFHAGFIPEEPHNPLRTIVLDRLRVIADIFSLHGVEVALETGQETAETLAGMLDELDRATVGVNFDPANMILYAKGDPIEALRLLSPRVRQIHVKDAIPTKTPGTWGSEVPAGQGAVDWDAFFEIARRIHPPLNFVIERESRAAKEEDLVAARELIAAKLGRE